MVTLDLRVDSTDGSDERRVDVDRIVNCGYTGRNEDEVRKHIEELEEEGVPAPESYPTLYPKPHHQLSTGGEIEVISDRTSGEAEFVLLPTGSETLVGVGSDHTDRELERDDIPRAKAVCQNVMGDAAWVLEDIVDHWDRLELRSWVGSERELYQETTLDAILPPEELRSLVVDSSSEPIERTAIFSGSVGVEGGELVYTDRFECELYDPVLDRSIDVVYDIRELTWLG